jgi:hypothetical protein
MRRKEYKTKQRFDGMSARLGRQVWPNAWRSSQGAVYVSCT